MLMNKEFFYRPPQCFVLAEEVMDLLCGSPDLDGSSGENRGWEGDDF